MSKIKEDSSYHTIIYPQKINQNHCGSSNTLATYVVMSVSLIISGLSLYQVQNLSSQMSQFYNQSSKIEERQNSHKDGMKQMKQDFERQLSESQKYLQTTHISYLRNDIDEIKKDLFRVLSDIQMNEKNVNILFDQISNRMDQIQTRVDAIQNEQNNFLANESSLTAQVNQHQNSINRLNTKVYEIALSSPNVDSLKQEVSEIKDSLNSLNLKIDIDTFNKIELFGPYYPNQHQVQIPLTKIGYSIFQTKEACIITIKSKAIVTLIATGHSYSSQGPAQLTFTENRYVNLPLTNNRWYFGTQFVSNYFYPVNLTQEFMVEAGTYEFALVALCPFQSTTIYLNAVSFVAKVTYMS